MSEQMWFSDNVPRRIILRSTGGLVGKKPTKYKSIKAMVTMPLTGGGENQVSNLPEWLEQARNFVMRSGETVTAPHVIKSVNVIMGDENLFKKTPTEAPRTQIDHFVVKQMGSKEDPDTVVTFEMRTQYSTDLWMWLGQMGGEEFDVTFEIIGQPQQEGDLLLTSEDDDEEDEDEDDASEEHDIEAEWREALKPEHDHEFDPVVVASGPPAPRASKPKPIDPNGPEAVAKAKKALQLM